MRRHARPHGQAARIDEVAVAELRGAVVADGGNEAFDAIRLIRARAVDAKPLVRAARLAVGQRQEWSETAGEHRRRR